jgi:hypothetical protein
MIAAIYELNGRILKTTNLTKKLKRLKSEPKILFQLENGTEADLDQWIKDNQNINSNSEKEDIEIKKYHYRNPITGYTITSIYDNLDVNGYIKID